MQNIHDLPLVEQIRTLKREFHLMMNGVVSQSMREKGLTYRTNFGVELPRLQAFSTQLPHTEDLALALWKEQVRECRLLAPMLMPPSAFQEDMAELWVEQIQFPEEAECLVMFLFQHLPYASGKAFEWIARAEDMPQICGWMLLGRLFAKGATPSARDAEELLDQLQAALHDTNYHIRQAAYKTLLKFMDLNEEAEQKGEAILNALGM
jgi:3-methyladenine DNA glycosylase AlkD